MNIKLKALGFLLVIFCTAVKLHAQQGVVSSGGDITSASGSVAYSIGQPFYNHIDVQSGSLNQGLQQPVVFTIVGIKDLQEDISVRLFPNPANQFVNIQWHTGAEASASAHFSARVYDLKGQLLLTQNLTEDINTISIQSLSEAMYLLQIWQDQHFIKSYALIKSN